MSERHEPVKAQTSNVCPQIYGASVAKRMWMTIRWRGPCLDLHERLYTNIHVPLKAALTLFAEAQRHKPVKAHMCKNREKLYGGEYLQGDCFQGDCFQGLWFTHWVRINAPLNEQILVNINSPIRTVLVETIKNG